MSRVCAKRPRGMAQNRKERAILWDRQGGRCYWCGLPMHPHPHKGDGTGATKDHVFVRHERKAMLARGEKAGIVNAKVLAHRKCNTERGDTPFGQWEKMKRRPVKEGENVP